MRKKALVIIGTAVGLIVLWQPLSHAGRNLLLGLMEPAYKVPEQSSVFTFTPTVMNEGSGDWWLYGEDGEYYYAADAVYGDAKPAVSDAPFIAHRKGTECQGFMPNDYTTWCKQ